MSEEKRYGSAEEITVDEAVERIGFGRFQVLLTIICGCLQCAIALEWQLLTIIGPVLQCSWSISATQSALVTTFSFIGNLIGCPIWGSLADRYGRRPIIIATPLIMGYFGLQMGFAPTLNWILCLRLIVGIHAGSMRSTVTGMLSEYMPKRYRAHALLAMLWFWSVGSVVMAEMSYAIVPTLGLRWLMVLASLPLTAGGLVCYCWMPVSPRYLLLAGKPESTMQVLNLVARTNGRPPLNIKLHEQTTNEAQGSWRLLFHSQYCRVTILLWIIWSCAGFCYYGITLVGTVMPEIPHRCLQNFSQRSIVEIGMLDNSCCNEITKNNYIAMISAALGEMGAIPVNFLLLSFVGRKPTLAINGSFALVSFVVVNFCMPQLAMDACFFFIRAFSYAAICTAYVYSSESYPTSIRVLGIACCTSFKSVGGILTPFVAQVMLLQVSTIGANFVYAGAMFAIMLSSMLLPFETNNRAMPQTTNEGMALLAGETTKSRYGHMRLCDCGDSQAMN